MLDDDLHEAMQETKELEQRYKIPYKLARSIVDGSILKESSPMNEIKELSDKYDLPYSIAKSIVNKTFKGGVLQNWVLALPLMQQTVLLSAIRNADGVAKFHKQKPLIRWYRRCVLLSAFDGKALLDPSSPGGGSFTGPVEDINKALDDFIDSRDEMSLHYFAHAMHAFEIIGYKHFNEAIRSFWYEAYKRMAHCLHVWPESEGEMDKRLGDNEEGWRARNDPSSTCSD